MRGSLRDPSAGIHCRTPDSAWVQTPHRHHFRCGRPSRFPLHSIDWSRRPEMYR